MIGYLQLNREFLTSDFRQSLDSNTFTVYMDLMMNAYFADSVYKKIPIKRGDVITGRKALAQRTNMSEQNVRTALLKLAKKGVISKKSTNRFSIITIKNYDEYTLQKNKKSEAKTEKNVVRKFLQDSQKKYQKKVINQQHQPQNKKILNNNNITNCTNSNLVTLVEKKTFSCDMIDSEDNLMKWKECETYITKYGTESECRLVFIYNYLNKHIRQKTEFTAFAEIMRNNSKLAVELSKLYLNTQKVKNNAKNKHIRCPQAYQRSILYAIKGQSFGKWDIDDMVKKIKNYIRNVIEKKVKTLKSEEQKAESKKINKNERSRSDEWAEIFNNLSNASKEIIKEKAIESLKSENKFYKPRENCIILRAEINTILEKDMTHGQNATKKKEVLFTS
jgi:predicted transcriptional regulator